VIKHFDKQIVPVLLALSLAAATWACAGLPAIPVASTTPTVAPPLASPSAAASVTAAPAADTPSPTGSPFPDLPAPPTSSAAYISRLPAGAELELESIKMTDSQRGWGLGRVGQGDMHVLRTDDGGQTWRDVTPAQPQDEAGRTLWASAYFGGDQVAWAVFYPAAPDASGPVAVVVWRTVDGGQSWTPSQPVGLPIVGSEVLPADLVFSGSDMGWLLAYTGPAGMHQHPVFLLRTTDGGATWQGLIAPGGGSRLDGCTKTGVAFLEDGYGLAGIRDCPMDGPIIATTNDFGATWEPGPIPVDLPGDLETAFCDVGAPTAFADLTIYVPGVCKLFVEGAVEPHPFLFRSSDSGSTWAATPYPGGSVYFLDRMVGWTTGPEIWFTDDGGATWSPVKTVAWRGRFSFVSPDLGWAVAYTADEVGLVRTDDGGATWDLLKPVVAN
jgi:photosystem II stability/assembly factor-like uncharacterized protein